MNQAGDTGEFELDLGAEAVQAFSSAAGDTHDYGGTVPPMAPVGKSLGMLVDALEGSSGAVHLSETIQFIKPVPAGAKLKVRTAMGPERQRMGQRFATVEKEFVLEDGSVAMSAKTVLTMGAPQQEGGRDG